MTGQKQKRPGGTGLGVGASSILVIFVLLCLVTFAALSLVSARADWNLSRKAADHTLEYHTASNAAEETLAGADALLADCWRLAKGDESDYLARARAALAGLGEVAQDGDGLRFSFSVQVNEGQSLACELRVQPPRPEKGTFYEIVRWQVESAGEWQPDEGLPVYGGDGDGGTGALPGRP